MAEAEALGLLSLSLAFSLSTCLSVYLPTYLPIHMSVCLSIHAPIHLSIGQSYLSIAGVPIYVSICMTAKHLCETFFKSSSWPVQNLINSAILPSEVKIDKPKTQQFCETSSIFEVDNIENETILRDPFKYGKLSAELTASYQWVAAIFPFHLSKVHLLQQSEGMSRNALHLSRKLTSANLTI